MTDNKMVEALNLYHYYHDVEEEGTDSKKGESTEEVNIEEKKNIVYSLSDVNLTIERGQFVCILGHNGSGKSTFAKHINVLNIPTSGKMLVNGLDTADLENTWTIRSKAGMVFQNPDNQMVATIVEEDVAFGCENLGIEPGEIRRRVDEALNMVNMYEYRKHAPHLLSGGQKQRVAIAGILAMKPDCIVFDEPTAMLDPSGRAQVMETVKQLNKEMGMTVIHITHYMEETVDADRLIVFDKGKVILDDKPVNVFSNVEQIKSIGLDVPQTTEVAYQLKKMGLDIDTHILKREELVERLCQLKQNI